MRLTITMSDLAGLIPQSGPYDGLAATADLAQPIDGSRPVFYVSINGGPVFYDDPDTGRTEVWAGLSLSPLDVRSLLGRADLVGTSADGRAARAEALPEGGVAPSRRRPSAQLLP